MPFTDYIKRIFVYVFQRKRIEESIRTRKGRCKQCGKCCRIFGIRCPFLSKDNRCRIYRFRPKILCKLPPLNLYKGEIEKHKEINCGYYWAAKKRKKN